MSRNGKVIVAMSGGVDSSVAACLLKEQGYDCVGVFMRVGVSDEATEAVGSAVRTDHGVGSAMRTDHGVGSAVRTDPASSAARRLKHGCCSVADALDARAIAGQLGIPFYVLNFQADFERIIAYFVDEYARARTPNPCVLCNIQLKFGKLLRYADLLDAQFVATGHYARIARSVPLLGEQCGASATGPAPGTADTALAPGARDTACRAVAHGDVSLARAVNRAKDQSYVLFGIRRADLPRCLFPIGEIADKAEVRRIAAELGLRVYAKPDSQEICFVPDGDYKQLVRARRPETQRSGEVRDAAGNVLGTHAGIANYTIGQRHGLGIAAGKPVYVTRLDVLDNRVTVGPRVELLSTGLIAEQVNWLSDPPPVSEWRRATVKIRHMHTPAAGAIRVAAGPALDGAVAVKGLCTGRSVAAGLCIGPSVAAGASPAVVEVRFDEPQSAVTPGQAAVFYDGDVVLGGGWIVRGIENGE